MLNTLSRLMIDINVININVGIYLYVDDYYILRVGHIKTSFVRGGIKEPTYSLDRPFMFHYLDFLLKMSSRETHYLPFEILCRLFFLFY